jgi:hypothetical protein
LPIAYGLQKKDAQQGRTPGSHRVRV